MKQTYCLMSFQELIDSLQKRQTDWSIYFSCWPMRHQQTPEDLLERMKDTWWLVRMPLSSQPLANSFAYAADSLADALRRYPKTPFSSGSAAVWSKQDYLDMAEMWTDSDGQTVVSYSNE